MGWFGDLLIGPQTYSPHLPPKTHPGTAEEQAPRAEEDEQGRDRQFRVEDGEVGLGELLAAGRVEHVDADQAGVVGVEGELALT